MGEYEARSLWSEDPVGRRNGPTNGEGRVNSAERNTVDNQSHGRPDRQQRGDETVSI